MSTDPCLYFGIYLRNSSYSLIYPQSVTLYQVDDQIYEPKEVATTNLFNTFLDALDGVGQDSQRQRFPAEINSHTAHTVLSVKRVITQTSIPCTLTPTRLVIKVNARPLSTFLSRNKI